MNLSGLSRKLTQGRVKLLNQLGTPVAIDFGVGTLKLLQISADDPPALVSAASLPTPDDLLARPADRLAFQVEALPRLVRSCEFKGRRAVCAIPAGNTYCKHLQLQVTEGASLASMVRAAVGTQLGCDPGALVFRHVEVEPAARAGSKTDVICMAVARDLVTRLMQAIKSARLEPVGLHCEFTATVRAFDSIHRRAGDEKLTTLYLDVGAGSTKVMIAHGRQLVFGRTIELGGRHLDESIVRQTKVDLAEARRQRLAIASFAPPNGLDGPRGEVPSGKFVGASPDGAEAQADEAAVALAEDRRLGRPPRGFTPELTSQPARAWAPPSADLTEPLEILTDEVSLCLRYHESLFPDRRVDRAIFVGGEARHLGLCQHVARKLRLAAQVADPLASIARTGKEKLVGVDLAGAQPGWAMVLGLCLSPTDL